MYNQARFGHFCKGRGRGSFNTVRSIILINSIALLPLVAGASLGILTVNGATRRMMLAMDQIRFEGTPHIFTPAAASFERGGGSPKGPLNTKYTHDPAEPAWKE